MILVPGACRTDVSASLLAVNQGLFSVLRGPSHFSPFGALHLQASDGALNPSHALNLLFHLPQPAVVNFEL